MKYGRNLKRIPGLAEANLTIVWLCVLYDKFDETMCPRMWNVLMSLMNVFLKMK